MSDTLKTTAGGSLISAVTWMDWLPAVVSVCVGLMTAVYLGIRIYKELRK